MAKVVTKEDFDTAVMLMDRGVPTTRVAKLLGYASGTLYVWKKQNTWEQHEKERMEFARKQHEKKNAAPIEKPVLTQAPQKSEEAVNSDPISKKLDRIIELLENATTPVDRKVTTRSEVARHLFGS